MIGNALRAAPRAVLLRLARTTPAEWGYYVVGAVPQQRNVVGHLEDWQPTTGIGIAPASPLYTDAERIALMRRNDSLMHRLGSERTGEIIIRAAKRCLGKGLD